ncbi:MAG TPA: GNAT family N-acetyltransferase [Dehalococcoidia bacterium]|nr:GNAT family N-acetyltransferase [Dehalococcoidia bacterium]
MAETSASKASEPQPVLVHYGKASDATALNDLYNHYIETTPITFDLKPWSLEQRLAWVDGFREGGPYRLLVAERDGVLAGYACSTRFRDKAAYSSTIETSIYCRHDVIGNGIGSLLYEALFEALRGEPVHKAIAGITLPNDASVALHRRFGFKLTGVNHEVGRKFDQYWDVAWYEKALE